MKQMPFVSSAMAFRFGPVPGPDASWSTFLTISPPRLWVMKTIGFFPRSSSNVAKTLSARSERSIASPSQPERGA